jgi:hypothetical protein
VDSNRKLLTFKQIVHSLPDDYFAPVNGLSCLCKILLFPTLFNTFFSPADSTFGNRMKKTKNRICASVDFFAQSAQLIKISGPLADGRKFFSPLFGYAALIVDRVFVVIMRARDEVLLGHVFTVKVLDKRLDGIRGHLARELLG